nr:MAG TPA: hypothetical protein [Caudoviricetes sp.]
MPQALCLWHSIYKITISLNKLMTGIEPAEESTKVLIF